MAPAVAAHQLAGAFHILEDLLGSQTTAPADAREVLEELPVEHRQNKGAAGDAGLEASSVAVATDKAHHQSPSSFETSRSIKAKLAWRAPRNRRPQIESETFEPLDAVLEETSLVLETEASVSASSPRPAAVDEAGQGGHPLTALDTNYNDVHEQVEKHLEGRFEWLITYPAPTSLPEGRASRDDEPSALEGVIYGCNYLPRSRRSSSAEQNETGHRPADSYTFLATPLKIVEVTPSEMDGSHNGVVAASCQPPLYSGDPLKAAQVVAMLAQALSPSTSVASERSSSGVDGATRAASPSFARIEDSLEELDKLEEELEAVNAATLPRAVAFLKDKPTRPVPETPSDQKKHTVVKRASLAGQSATVRMKSSETTRPAASRYASLTLRDKKPERPHSVAEQKAAATLPRIKSMTLGATTPKPAAKLTKPYTVPRFELPGDAVARRLKELREARQAHQAMAQMAQVSSPKPKAHRSLARPTFELPGEAISRRKREERETKLRAEEEEERKRREFKARPVRHSIGPTTLPRDTVASRARQNRASQEDSEANQAEADKTKRMSLGPGRATITAATLASNNSHGSPQARGRNSMVLLAKDMSRATSASTGATSASTSTSGKRSTLSAEELEQQRQRGKQIFARDSLYSRDKERDRRDRELTAKMAREQAAERSRVASREWAEQKRRKKFAAAKEAAMPAKQQTGV